MDEQENERRRLGIPRLSNLVFLQTCHLERSRFSGGERISISAGLKR